MTRADTLLVALAVVQAVLGALCVTAGRSDKNLSALHLWGWGLMIHAAGVVTLLVPGVPRPVGQIGGHTLIALSPIVSVTGILLHTRIRLRRRWAGIGLVVSVVPILVNHAQPSPAVIADVLASTPVAVVLYLLTAWALVRRSASKTGRAARLVAAALMLAAAASVLRVATAWPYAGAATRDYGVAEVAVSLFAISQVVATVAATFGLLWIDVRRLGSTVERLVHTDPLTGLPNRRAALKRFADEAARAVRHERAFAMLLFEVDRFKAISDMRGPLACDAVLRHVADTLRRGMRAEDVPSHLGGNAFVVLLPEQMNVGAAQSSVRLRELVAATPCSFDAWPLTVTVSSGMAVFPADGRHWDELFTVASRRLLLGQSGPGPLPAAAGRQAST